MKKINWLIYGTIAVLISVGWFAVQKITEDKYEGMSIIPEQQKDIPLFEGLKPADNEYKIKGNRWKDINGFYLKELPKEGWKVEYKQSSSENEEVTGFISRWRKKGLDWELSITGSYFKMNNQTEVIFDKYPIYNSSIWINSIPSSICIYQTPSDDKCYEIQDKSQIEEIVHFINDANDWDGVVSPREKTSVISFGDLEVKVLYESDKEIYFQSEKGTKIMKPELDFFKLTTLKNEE